MMAFPLTRPPLTRTSPCFLYPDDSDEAGRQLRVYQQYLMVSAGAQLILAECAARGCNYHDLADYAAIQINDTHPSMVDPGADSPARRKGHRV